MTQPNDYFLHARRLLQQFVVDTYAHIECECLFWIRREQRTLRAENYQALTDAFHTEDFSPIVFGQRVILPSSFVGGPRYMLERQQDAINGIRFMRFYGRANLFITSYHQSKMGGNY